MIEIPESGEVEIILPLSGLKVAKCQFEYAFVIQFEFGVEEELTILIEGTFYLKDRNEVLSFSPQDSEKISPAFVIGDKTVKNALIYSNGNLRLDFTDASTLLVPSDELYEPWQVTGPNNLLMVSLPGGKIAYWEIETLKTLGNSKI